MLSHDEAVELAMHVLYDTLKGYQVSGKAIVANHSRIGTCVVPIVDFSIETTKIDIKNATSVKAWILTPNKERLWIGVEVDNRKFHVTKLEFMKDIEDRLKTVIQTIPDTELGRVLYDEGGTNLTASGRRTNESF